eukprot:GHVU01212503.1.p2 GENE.GHVU01212503.1~~GHVU01212503.1.p2  ORF type:complete len:122 (-),score=13.15 GHVU01212503.1:246-611(-)
MHKCTVSAAITPPPPPPPPSLPSSRSYHDYYCCCCFCSANLHNFDFNVGLVGKFDLSYAGGDVDSLGRSGRGRVGHEDSVADHLRDGLRVGAGASIRGGRGGARCRSERLLGLLGLLLRLR